MVFTGSPTLPTGWAAHRLVELGHELAEGGVLVEAALVLAARVVGIFLGGVGEGLAGLDLRQDLLGLGLGLLVGERLLVALGLGADQDVPGGEGLGGHELVLVGVEVGLHVGVLDGRPWPGAPGRPFHQGLDEQLHVHDGQLLGVVGLVLQALLPGLGRQGLELQEPLQVLLPGALDELDLHALLVVQGGVQEQFRNPTGGRPPCRWWPAPCPPWRLGAALGAAGRPSRPPAGGGLGGGGLGGQGQGGRGKDQAAEHGRPFRDGDGFSCGGRPRRRRRERKML